MDHWEYQHTVMTRACRKDAWAYCTNFDNAARMEPGVERIELDGPFASGTTGRTVTLAYTQSWELQDVVWEEQYTILGRTPDGGFMRFTWTFEEMEAGTRLTQLIRAGGEQLEAHRDALHQMEEGVVPSMSKLVQALDALANTTENDDPDPG